MPKTIQFTTERGEVWEAVILPEHGANCVRLSVTRDVETIPEWVDLKMRNGYGHFPDLEKHVTKSKHTDSILEDVPLEQVLKSPTSYGMPILFPYAGRVGPGDLEDGQSHFTWHGERYVVDPSRHGLVRHRPWEVVDSSEIHCVCQTTVTPSAVADRFPFHFAMTVNYRLGEDGLTARAVVSNLGDSFPYTFGWHPYFNRFCITTGITAATVKVPAASRWETDRRWSVPSGKILAVGGEYDLRAGHWLDQKPDPPSAPWRSEAAYDDVFTGLQPDAAGNVACEVVRGGDEVTRLSFAADDYPHVCVYVPQNRQAVCVEPYTGAPDAFNHPDDPRFGRRVLYREAFATLGPVTIGRSHD